MNDKKDKVLKLALDALDCIYSPLHVREINKVGAAMSAIRAALAEQPAQQQDIDWKYQYEKQKRRAEMWVAKYEADINPLEKAGPVTAQQQEMVQTEPNFEQRKQILDNLDRCLYQDSKHELLRVWIRDWTNHKLSKQTPPRKPWVGLTEEQKTAIMREHYARTLPLMEAVEQALMENNT